MKLILTQNVQDLGGKGDVVDVAEGYGRNYLVPRGYAVKATRGALRQAESMQRARVEAESKALAEAEALATALVGTRVVVAARSGDEGKLFGSIGSSDIVEAIKKFTGVEVDRAIVAVTAPIKEIGMVMTGMMVARRLPRNTKITITTRLKAISNVMMTSPMASEMNVEES